MSAPVVGRDDQLARVDRFVNGVDGGHAALVIEGEAGIGKSTVWRAGVDGAVRGGFRVLVSRPAESEAALAYSGLADLLAGVDSRSWRGLPEPQRRALDIALLREELDGHAPEPRAIFAGFGGVLQALGSDAPVLVAVDDRQWLDSSSWRALEYVVRRLDGGRVRLLSTTRPDSSRSWLPADDALRLGGLTPGALHQLIKAHSGVSLPRSSVLRVHRMTGGNPFFALQVTAVLVEVGLPAATEAWPVPEDLREMVAARLGLLPPQVRSTLLTAAATARPTVSGLDGPSLRAAEDAGIVTIAADGRVRFAHPLFASAIYGSAAPVARRRVHAILADDEEDVEESARHRALSTGGSDDQVARLLDRVSDDARRRGAPDVAAELAERAAALTPPDRARARWERRVTAAEHHFHAGDLPRARELLVELMDRAAPDWGVSRAWRLLGETCHRLGFVEQGLQFLRQAVDTADGDAASVARAEMSFAVVVFGASGNFEEAAAGARRAATLAETLEGEEALLACALAMSEVSELMLGRRVDHHRLERALALEDPDQPTPVELRPSTTVAMVLLFEEQFDEARARYEQVAARLVEHGDYSELPYVVAELARLECLAGNVARAAELADQGFAEARQSGSDSLASVTRAVRGIVYAHEGRIDETRTAAAEAIELAEASGYRVGAAWACQALALLEVSLGNDQAVLAALSHWLGVVEQSGVVDPSRRRFIPDAIEAMVRLGQLQRAENLTQQLEECARALQRPSAIVAAARCRALIGAARGDVRAALEGLDRVLRDTPAVPIPLELARALIVKGQLERRAKRKRESAASLSAALQLCDSIGATLWSHTARTELDRLGRPVPPGELTTTEARIASLVASGLTNRDVAAAAFVSVKTVEANISRIYRKLGIHSRVELGAWLAGRDHHDSD